MEKYEKIYKPLYSEECPTYMEKYNHLKSLPSSVVVNEETNDEYIFVKESDMGYFPITSVSREDFEATGYDASGLTDEQMEYLADKMSDAYVENGGYWEYLEYFAEENNLPKITKKEELN